MPKIVGVRFKKTGKTYYFDPKELELSSGMHVIVETARGIEYGEVVMDPREAGQDEIVSPLKDVLRVATQEDDKIFQDNLAKAKKAFDICLEKISHHKLDMKLIDVEYTFDNNKVCLLYTSRCV